MKVVFHKDFYKVYTSDPASAYGRMEAIVNVLDGEVEFVPAEPATEEQIRAVHYSQHIEYVKNQRLYDISALAAGGAIQAARIGLTEPAFGLIRPPGHHASAQSCWGFCYFNNMSIALETLKNENKISSAYVLDIDLHYGDGNVNILGKKDYVKVYNVEARDRIKYMLEVAIQMDRCNVDLIGISAGFDNHMEDWGGVLCTDDYKEIGRLVRAAADRSGGGCFAILEGGYNHNVLGYNALALIQGMSTSTHRKQR
jgi:acetoin utilization deacetylase AcuC-like enzyme